MSDINEIKYVLLQFHMIYQYLKCNVYSLFFIIFILSYFAFTISFLHFFFYYYILQMNQIQKNLNNRWRMKIYVRYNINNNSNNNRMITHRVKMIQKDRRKKGPQFLQFLYVVNSFILVSFCFFLFFKANNFLFYFLFRLFHQLIF